MENNVTNETLKEFVAKIENMSKEEYNALYDRAIAEIRSIREFDEEIYYRQKVVGGTNG